MNALAHQAFRIAPFELGGVPKLGRTRKDSSTDSVNSRATGSSATTYTG